MLSEYTTQVEAIVRPVAENMRLELIEVSVKPKSKSLIVQVFVDRPQGGITVDECAAINRHLVDKIEEGLLFDDYTVEVSSPGLDRPLKTVKDFVRAAGRQVRFHLLEPVANKVEHWGIVSEVKDNTVTIQVKTGSIDIPLEKISKAVQII